jgi:ArsR family transcriptional regulator
MERHAYPDPALMTDAVARFADMLTAMGTEPRLRIVRLLLSAHPQGMIVGDIGAELQITGSTLSHHLEKLQERRLGHRAARRHLSLVFAANTQALQELLASCTPSAARATRPSSRRPSSAAAECLPQPCPPPSNRGQKMNTEVDVKEVVKNRYGAAATRVAQGAATLAAALRPPAWAAPTRSPPICTTPCRPVMCPKRPCWPRWAAATPRRWPN